jgi:alpha-1,2-mannosyltransferase
MPTGWLALGIFLPLLVLYVATGNVDSVTQSADPNSAALAAWNWVVHHTHYMDGLFRPNVWFIVVHDHLVTNRTPGVIAFGTPFYWLFGNSAQFSAFPAAVASSAAAAGAVTLLILALRRLLGSGPAVAAGLTLGLGTATWSVSANALWTHGPDQLFLCAAMLALSRGRRTLAAVAIALTVPIRAHLAVVAFVAGIWYAARQRSARPLMNFGLPVLIALGLLIAYNQWQFDTWQIQGGRPHVTRYLEHTGGRANIFTNILGSFVSLDRGLLIWFPLLGVLAFAIKPAWRQAPTWVRVCAIGAIAYFVIQMKVDYFTGGDNFWSYRLTIESVTLSAPLLAYAARHIAMHHPVLRRLAIVSGIYGIGTQAIGALYFTADHRAHDPWWHSNLAHQLVTGGLGPRILLAITTAVAVLAAALPQRPPSPSVSVT